MEKRRLGRSGLQIAPLMLGGNVFGWTADEAASHRVLDAFVDAGFNAIDTADVYSAWAPGHSGGESEAMIGSWLGAGGKRDKIVLATKLGMLAPNNGLRAAQITTAVEASLKRLKTDYIDLYQAHRDDETASLDETLEAFDGLVKAGKVRVLGASNYEADRLKRALKVSEEHGFARYESLQPEYNLMVRAKFEEALRQVCLDEEVGVITYYSLAGGFLSGKYRSKEDLAKSPRGRGAEKYLTPKGLAVLEALETVAGDHGASLSEVAVAWVMAQPGVTAAIASARSLDQLEPLLRSARLVLRPQDLDLLDRASA